MEEETKQNESNKVDRFGFYVRGKPRTPNSAEILQENERLQKWRKMMDKWDETCKNEPELVEKRILKGIPDALRGSVWSLLLHLKEVKEIYPNHYSNLLKRVEIEPKNDITCEGGVIDRDLGRTFPTQEDFAKNGGFTQKSLRNVLMAYAIHDTKVQYCQGMNYLVGLFLCYMTEEDSFWTLVQLMDNYPYEMSPYFEAGFPSYYMIINAFSIYLERYVPHVFKKIEEFIPVLQFLIMSWFTTVFSYSFPFDIVSHVWDIFIYKGWTIVIQVVLAIFKLYDKEIIAADDEELRDLLRTIPERQDLPSANTLIQKALAYNVTNEEIKTINNQYIIHNRLRH
ncbi:hypothetical protein WA158_007831 [Blastocystis sp. Blastoise]